MNDWDATFDMEGRWTLREGLEKDLIKATSGPTSNEVEMAELSDLELDGLVQTWQATDGRLFKLRFSPSTPPSFAVCESCIDATYARARFEGTSWRIKLTEAGLKGAYGRSILDRIEQVLRSKLPT